LEIKFKKLEDIEIWKRSKALSAAVYRSIEASPIVRD